MTEQNPPNEQTEPSESGKPYAVYDETLQRFIGGTFDTRAAANEHKSKNGPDGHKLVVRAVDKR